MHPYPSSRVIHRDCQLGARAIITGLWLPSGNFFATLNESAILLAMQTEPPQICAAEVVFRVVRGRWALPLLLVLAEQGPVHFLAIFRQIPGISRKVLTEQLRFFENAGVVHRYSTQSQSQVFYELTPRGRELKKAVDGLNELAARWFDL